MITKHNEAWKHVHNSMEALYIWEYIVQAQWADS